MTKGYPHSPILTEEESERLLAYLLDSQITNYKVTTPPAPQASKETIEKLFNNHDS